ncbi:twin-arginine translocase TatA/TatE family subunit [Cellulosimicrobium arenosum]|uniref:Twin-arginine translocase TatA/TatE family subunit n=1 Tax=Cellulosimicrobium arenosum TaxID=2708133 RepID=A0A927G759_9MICO|nr:twin-arginine translocase TatA/TatE family subunit [Cellulosimicrobium arenosum]
MFGINGAEFVVLLVVAVIVIGPERLPRYAEQLGSFVRSARGYLRDAKARVDEEIGAEVGDVDWSKLDPRQYDPRRIVREALLDDDPAPIRPAVPVHPPPPPAPVPGPAPFDDEAT